MDRLIQSDMAVITAQLAECNCPDDCERDHEND